MTREDIIRMARKAWISEKEAELISEFDEAYLSCTYLADIERFAKLVAAAEREACAKVCDTIHELEVLANPAEKCAAAIRARGQQ